MRRDDDKMLRISGETYAALREMAAASGETLKTAVARAVETEWRQRKLEKASGLRNEGPASIPSDRLVGVP